MRERLSVLLAAFLATTGLIQASAQRAKAASATATQPATQGVRVYSSAFAIGKTDPLWSNAPIEKCPSGKRTFLGKLSNESTTLSLDNLPDHARVHVSFDLMILLSWDGDHGIDNPDEIGPDSINVTVHGGPRLLNASFVIKPSAANVTQSFPGMFPYDHVNYGTTAIESGTLGYVWGGVGPGTDDYVYHVERTFTHSAKSLKIAFSGIHLQGVADEAWGLDNVKVSVLPAAIPQAVDPRIFSPWCDTLANADPQPAVAAIAAMVDLGDSALPELRQRMQAKKIPADRDALTHQLITELDSDSFEAREKASAALKALTPSPVAALHEALNHETLPIESRSRIEAILATMSAESPDERRTRRIVEILELIGTSEARKLLAEVAANGTGYTAYEAKAAVNRLDGTAPIPTKLDLPPGLPPPPAPQLSPPPAQ